MDRLFIPLVVLATTMATWVFTRPRPTQPSLYLALGEFFEFCGTLVLFLLLNVAVIGALVLTGRVLRLPFVSFYLIGDPMLIVFSVVQVLLFWLWRRQH